MSVWSPSGNTGGGCGLLGVLPDNPEVLDAPCVDHDTFNGRATKPNKGVDYYRRSLPGGMYPADTPGSALAKVHPTRQLTVAATVRNRLLSLPGRFVNYSGRHILRLPLNWPWKHTFTTALQHLHNLPRVRKPADGSTLN